MKKGMKKAVCLVLAVGMIAASMLIPDTKASASAAADKIRIWTKTQSSMMVELAAGDYKIANLKSSKKNLLVRTTYTYSYDKKYSGSATISMYAKKKGTYTVTFDVVDRSNKKLKSHSVKVYAADEPAVKKAEFGGSEIFYGSVCEKSSGTFKVTMNKGYRLKSITIHTYDKNGKSVSKKFKNGKKAALGKYRRISEGSKGKDYEYWSASLLAETYFEIAYIDKYTKKEAKTSYYLYRLPLN